MSLDLFFSKDMALFAFLSIFYWIFIGLTFELIRF